MWSIVNCGGYFELALRKGQIFMLYMFCNALQKCRRYGKFTRFVKNLICMWHTWRLFQTSVFSDAECLHLRELVEAPQWLALQYYFISTIERKGYKRDTSTKQVRTLRLALLCVIIVFQNSFGLVTLFVQALVQNDFNNCSDPPAAPSSPLHWRHRGCPHWSVLITAQNRQRVWPGWGDKTKENGDHFFW